jgi:hypothetical protein
MQQYTKPFRLLMNDNPFFGLYLLGVNKYEVDHSIPIAAVAMEGYNFKLLLRKGACSVYWHPQGCTRHRGSRGG